VSYDGEICQECGFPVAHFVGSYWSAPNELWNLVMGTPDNPRGEGDVVCPPCFTRLAEKAGYHVSWRAVGA